VSRRFVLGDRKAHRLLIVDEVSRNVVNFVSAASAGFYEQLTAFTIDARRGDLWVASARGSGDAAESIVHKLQLVSGRALMEAHAPDRSGPIRFVAVAATPTERSSRSTAVVRVSFVFVLEPARSSRS
jgi:hypothetical protein